MIRESIRLDRIVAQVLLGNRLALSECHSCQELNREKLRLNMLNIIKLCRYTAHDSIPDTFWPTFSALPRAGVKPLAVGKAPDGGWPGRSSCFCHLDPFASAEIRAEPAIFVREGHRPGQAIGPDINILAVLAEVGERSADDLERGQAVIVRADDDPVGRGLFKIRGDCLLPGVSRGVAIAEGMPVIAEPRPLAGGGVEAGGIDVPPRLEEVAAAAWWDEMGMPSRLGDGGIEVSHGVSPKRVRTATEVDLRRPLDRLRLPPFGRGEVCMRSPVVPPRRASV